MEGQDEPTLLIDHGCVLRRQRSEETRWVRSYPDPDRWIILPQSFIDLDDTYGSYTLEDCSIPSSMQQSSGICKQNHCLLPINVCWQNHTGLGTVHCAIDVCQQYFIPPIHTDHAALLDIWNSSPTTHFLPGEIKLEVLWRKHKDKLMQRLQYARQITEQNNSIKRPNFTACTKAVGAAERFHHSRQEC